MKGKINAITKLRCSPIHELQVGKSVQVAVYDILGEYDLILTWPEKNNLKDFIPALLKFREKWKNYLTLMDTSTAISSIEVLPLPHQRKLLRPEIADIPFFSENLGKVTKLKGINRYLINELICLVSLVNSYIAFYFSKKTFDNARLWFTPADNLLTEYIKCVKTASPIKKARIEARLLQFADSMRVTLSQRFPTIEITESEFSRPPSTVFAISHVLFAASSLVEYLFGMISRSSPPQKFFQEMETIAKKHRKECFKQKFFGPWPGFIYFDLKEGYQLYYGEIISLPLGNIYLPLNWLTVSHEVSHAYYRRIFFTKLESREFEHLSSRIEKEDPASLRIFEIKLKDLTWELFAHWFDYRHFYTGDLDYYLWSIWRTWLFVPRLFQQKSQYWMRSVFIRICHSWNTHLRSKFKEIDTTYQQTYSKIKEEKIKLLYEEYLCVRRFLNEKFNNEFSTFSLDAKGEEVLTEQLFYFYGFSDVFESRYFNVELLNLMNKKYDDLHEHVRDIIGGRVISGSIINPYILLREILRYFYTKKTPVKLSSQSIIALIYSLWGSAQKGGEAE